MIKKKNSCGFLLLEVLIGVIVILGLTLWWVHIQLHNDKKSMAKVMTQQMNSILNAVSNYYVDHPNAQSQWPHGILMSQLVEDKYIMQNQTINPFNFPYRFQADKRDNVLELITSVGYADAYVADSSIASLANSTTIVPVDRHSNVSIIVRMNQPITASDPAVVKFIGLYYRGEVVSSNKINCPSNYRPEIITTQKDCKKCIASAWYDPFRDGWILRNKQFIRSGWVNSYSPIEVSMTCRK